MKIGLLKLALFLHADNFMLDWCIDSATQTEIGRPVGTMSQVNSKAITNREVDCPEFQLYGKCSILKS